MSYEKLRKKLMHSMWRASTMEDWTVYSFLLKELTLLDYEYVEYLEINHYHTPREEAY